MTYQDISIGIIALIISCSGLLINLMKQGRREAILLEKDGMTLSIFRWVIPAVLLISICVYVIGWGHYRRSPILLYTGYGLVAAGLGIRWLAVAALGAAFTVKVSILRDHALKTKGMYRLVRHPSYTGLLLYYIGLGLVMQNWVCLLMLAAAPALVVLTRIKLEEGVLTEHFGQAYKSYTDKTWKLLPYIF